MARGVYSNSQANADGCCVAGKIYQPCNVCGGHPRTVSTCTTCRATGMLGYPCPVHAAYYSTGSYVDASNQQAYTGNAGYGDNSGYGQQGYGSTSGS